jgi:hypothetical protein
MQWTRQCLTIIGAGYEAENFLIGEYSIECSFRMSKEHGVPPAAERKG